MNKLELKEFTALVEKGHTIIDTRKPEMFVEEFIEDSVSIPFGEDFITMFEDLVESDQKVLVVAEENEIAALLKAIRDMGISNVDGFLSGGFQAWKESGNKTNLLISIEADEFAIDYKFDEFYLVDVRSKEDFEKERVEDSENIELNDLEKLLIDLDTEGNYYVYGNTAAEAITAASLFRKTGFHRVRPVAADYKTIKASGVPLFVRKKKSNHLNN